MIPIVQTRTGDIGNCFAACLASILEVPLQAVPEFPYHSDDEFFAAAQRWLATKGLRYRQVPIKNGYRPRGYTTIEGISPRGGQHACVALNGRLVWDPHPDDGTGHGLVKPTTYGLLEPLPVNEEN